MKNELTFFLRFTAIACFLSVVTTVGIHALFNFDATAFEERVLLFRDPLYILNRWWVIVHCLLVIISMWGFFIIQYKKSMHWVGLGFIFIFIFGIAEIYRQLHVLFYLNGMRQAYLETESADVKLFLANSINNFGLSSYAIFGLFVLTFALGNFFYGLSLAREKGLSKILSVLMFIWSAGVFLALGNEFWQWQVLSFFLPHYNLWFQSFMRALLGVWLWRMSTPSIV